MAPAPNQRDINLSGTFGGLRGVVVIRLWANADNYNLQSNQENVN